MGNTVMQRRMYGYRLYQPPRVGDIGYYEPERWNSQLFVWPGVFNSVNVWIMPPQTIQTSCGWLSQKVSGVNHPALILRN